MKVSSCCGVEPKCYNGPHGTPDSDSMDHGMCPECGEPCQYMDQEDYCNEVGIEYPESCKEEQKENNDFAHDDDFEGDIL